MSNIAKYLSAQLDPSEKKKVVSRSGNSSLAIKLLALAKLANVIYGRNPVMEWNEMVESPEKVDKLAKYVYGVPASEVESLPIAHVNTDTSSIDFPNGSIPIADVGKDYLYVGAVRAESDTESSDRYGTGAVAVVDDNVFDEIVKHQEMLIKKARARVGKIKFMAENQFSDERKASIEAEIEDAEAEVNDLEAALDIMGRGTCIDAIKAAEGSITSHLDTVGKQKDNIYVDVRKAKLDKNVLNKKIRDVSGNDWSDGIENDALQVVFTSDVNSGVVKVSDMHNMNRHMMTIKTGADGRCIYATASTLFGHGKDGSFYKTLLQAKNENILKASTGKGDLNDQVNSKIMRGYNSLLQRFTDIVKNGPAAYKENGVFDESQRTLENDPRIKAELDEYLERAKRHEIKMQDYFDKRNETVKKWRGNDNKLIGIPPGILTVKLNDDESAFVKQLALLTTMLKKVDTQVRTEEDKKKKTLGKNGDELSEGKSAAMTAGQRAMQNNVGGDDTGSNFNYNFNGDDSDYNGDDFDSSYDGDDGYSYDDDADNEPDAVDIAEMSVSETSKIESFIKQNAPKIINSIGKVRMVMQHTDIPCNTALLSEPVFTENTALFDKMSRPGNKISSESLEAPICNLVAQFFKTLLSYNNGEGWSFFDGDRVETDMVKEKDGVQYVDDYCLNDRAKKVYAEYKESVAAKMSTINIENAKPNETFIPYLIIEMYDPSHKRNSLAGIINYLYKVEEVIREDVGARDAVDEINKTSLSEELATGSWQQFESMPEVNLTTALEVIGTNLGNIQNVEILRNFANNLLYTRYPNKYMLDRMIGDSRGQFWKLLAANGAPKEYLPGRNAERNVCIETFHLAMNGDEMCGGTDIRYMRAVIMFLLNMSNPELTNELDQVNAGLSYEKDDIADAVAAMRNSILVDACKQAAAALGIDRNDANAIHTVAEIIATAASDSKNVKTYIDALNKVANTSISYDGNDKRRELEVTSIINQQRNLASMISGTIKLINLHDIKIDADVYHISSDGDIDVSSTTREKVPLGESIDKIIGAMAGYPDGIETKFNALCQAQDADGVNELIRKCEKAFGKTANVTTGSGTEYTGVVDFKVSPDNTRKSESKADIQVERKADPVAQDILKRLGKPASTGKLSNLSLGIAKKGPRIRI